MIMSAGAGFVLEFGVLFGFGTEKGLLKLTGSIQIIGGDKQPFGAVAFDADLVHPQTVFFQTQHGAFPQIVIVFKRKKIGFRDLFRDLHVVPFGLTDPDQCVFKIPHETAFFFFRRTLIVAFDPDDPEFTAAPIFHADNDGIAVLKTVVPVKCGKIKCGKTERKPVGCFCTAELHPVFFRFGGKMIHDPGGSQHEERGQQIIVRGLHFHHRQNISLLILQFKFIGKKFVAAEGNEGGSRKEDRFFDFVSGGDDPQFRSVEKGVFRIDFIPGNEQVFVRAEDQITFLADAFDLILIFHGKFCNGGIGEFRRGERDLLSKIFSQQIFNDFFDTVQIQHNGNPPFFNVRMY